MTVNELIDKLQEIEDKERRVITEVYSNTDREWIIREIDEIYDPHDGSKCVVLG